jgi:hypothetical protein
MVPCGKQLGMQKTAFAGGSFRQESITGPIGPLQQDHHFHRGRRPQVGGYDQERRKLRVAEVDGVRGETMLGQWCTWSDTPV